MKDILFTVLSTLIVLGIWVGVNSEITTIKNRPEKVLDKPIPIDGRIDLEFFQNLGKDLSPFAQPEENQESTPAL